MDFLNFLCKGDENFLMDLFYPLKKIPKEMLTVFKLKILILFNQFTAHDLHNFHKLPALTIPGDKSECM